MKCEDVQKNLWLYIDGECDSKISKRMVGHLGSCSDCFAVKEKLAPFSEAPVFEKQSIASLYLWTRLQARISEYETSKTNITGMLPRLVWKAGLLLLTVLALRIGIYLGTPSDSIHSSTIETDPPGEQIEILYSLFQPIPSQSLGAAYISIPFEN